MKDTIKKHLEINESKLSIVARVEIMKKNNFTHLIYRYTLTFAVEFYLIILIFFNLFDMQLPGNTSTLTTYLIIKNIHATKTANAPRLVIIAEIILNTK